jgi:predicted nucleic acid-binding protein
VTPDSSAIVAVFAPWHPLHEQTLAALDGAHDLVAHAELEAYSVLTRLPAPFRVDPKLAAEHLRASYPGARLVLPSTQRTRLLGQLARADVSGGRTYDALIAATAMHHGRRLVSCDSRAAPTYERVGASVELLSRPTAR